MASRNFQVSINLNQQELQNPRLQNLASAPGTPVAGQAYYDTVLGATYVWNGTAWAPADPAKAAASSIPNTALATNPLARANHTGLQLSGTISDFTSAVTGTRLSAFAAPNANIPVAGFKFTGHGTPTAAGDVAEYSWVIGQVQSAAAGIASKPPVRLLTNTNSTLSGLAAIDGVTPVAGDRILVTGQTTTTANGVYNAAAGAWARTTVDGPAPGELETGALWLVTEGTTFAASQWRMSTTGAITVGSTAIAIVQFGAAASYTASNGILLTGSNFTFAPASGGGLVTAAGGASIDTSIVARKFSATMGDGTATSFTITHNLGTQDVVMQVRQAATPFSVIECDMAATTTNTSTIAFNVAPAASAYRVTVTG